MSNDLAVGNTLVAGTTGWRYTVRRVTDDTVSVTGKRGPMTVPLDELEDGIEDGSVRVIQT